MLIYFYVHVYHICDRQIELVAELDTFDLIQFDRETLSTCLVVVPRCYAEDFESDRRRRWRP